MAELYNLGIGLTAVDTASKPIQAVDSALASMGRSTDDASSAAAGLEQQLQSTANQSRDLADIGNMLAEQLAAQQNISAERHARIAAEGGYTEGVLEREREKTEQLSNALGQLGQSLGMVGRASEATGAHSFQMRDEFGRFTTIALDGSLDSIAGQMGNVVQKGADLWDTMKGGSNGFRLLGGELKKVAGRINETVAGFESLSFLGATAQESFIDFEDSTKKLAMGFGGTREDAYELRSTMLDLGLSTQYSLGEVGKLTGELAEAGVDLRNVTKAEAAAFVALNTTWGVSGQEIAAMRSTMSAFGGDMVQTLDYATQFQRDFAISGVFAELPAVIASAETSIIQFGDAVAGSVPQVVRNITHQAGVVAKAYGKTMREAVQSATADFNRFVQASRTHGDVFLGLADGFDPLQEALMEVGVPLMQTADMMDQAQQSPLAFAGSMRSMMSSMGEFQQARFQRQLQMGGLSDELMGLITNEERYSKAMGAQAEARRRANMEEQTGASTFSELTAGMLDTVKETKAMWENVKLLGKAFLAQTGLTEVLIGAFGEAKDVFADWGKKIQAFVESGEMRTWGDKLVPVLKTVGKWFLIIGTAAGGAVGAIGSLFGALGSARAGLKGLKMVGGLFEKFSGKGILGGAVKLFGKLGSKIGVVAKMFGRAIPGIGAVISVVSGVSAALTDMGAIMGDPQATGAEKFQALIRGVVKGVGAAFNSLLLGIPGWIADKFFPDLGRRFDEGFANLFSGGGGGINIDVAGIGRWLGEKVGSAVSGIGKWVMKNLPDWKDTVGRWAKGIGSALGGLVRFAAEALVDYGPTVLYYLTAPFNPYVWWQAMKAAWGGVMGFIEGEAKSGVSEGMGDIFIGAWALVKEGTDEFLEGFLGAFSTSLDELSLVWQINWSHMKEFFHVSFLEMGNGVWTWLVDPVTEAASHIQFAFEGMWTRVGFAGKSAFASLEDAFSGNFSTMKIFGLSILKSIVSGLMEVPKAFIGVVKDLAGIANMVPGVNIDVSGLDAMTDSLDANTALFTNMIDEEQRSIESRGSRITAINAERATALAGLQTEHNNRLNAIDAETSARAHLIEMTKVGYEAERTNLSQQLISAAGVREARQQNEREAREFRRDSANAIDEALSELASKGESRHFDSGQMDAAERAMRDYMDSSLRTISGRVESGEIEIAQADALLTAARDEALRQAVDAGEAAERAAGRGAGETADAAGGGAAGAAAAASQAQMQTMMAQFSRSLAANRRQQVEIRFADRTGDAISRDLARRASVSAVDEGM